MGRIISSVKKFITEYTSGLPLILWMIAGVGIGLFIFLFRNNEHIDFEKLKYIILASAVWIISSDIFKKREILNKTFHFIIDSVVYLSLYSSIVYFSGGTTGGLYFIFFLGAISAPFFGSSLQTAIFLIALGLVRYLIFHFTFPNPDLFDKSLIGLEVLLYFIMAGVIRFSLDTATKLETEKRALAEKFMEECKQEVEEKTRILKNAQDQLKNINLDLEKRVLERTAELLKLKENLEERVGQRTKELEGKVEELERFHDLTVGREMKMIEMKKEIERLKKI